MKKAIGYFGLVMSIVFIGFAFMIEIRPPEGYPVFEGNNRHFIAIILLFYGLFRLVRSLKVLRENNNNIR